MHHQQFTIKIRLSKLLFKVYSILIHLKPALCLDELRKLIDRVLYIWSFVKALEYIVATLGNYENEAAHNFRAVHLKVVRR